MTAEVQTGSISASVPDQTVSVPSLRAQRSALRGCLVAGDAVALALAFLGAYWVRFYLQVTTAPEVVPIPYFYAMVAAVLTVLSIAVFTLFHLYDYDSLLGGVSEYARVFRASSTVAAIVILGTFFAPRFVVSRLFVMTAWLLSFALASMNRFLWRRVVYTLRCRGYFLAPALIVGTNEEAAALAADLSDCRSSGLRVAGFISTRPEVAGKPHVAEGVNLPVVGGLSDVRRGIEDLGVEELIVAITAIRREQLLELCERVNALPNVHLRLSSGLYELLTSGLTVETKGLVPLVTVNKLRLTTGEFWSKAVLEYSVAGAAILVLSPLLLLIAVLIKLDSRGPILFRRRVLGVSGKRFDAFKFRTMHVNGEDLLRQTPRLQEQLRAEHKLKHDPRVTRVGRWLRKYSLDELPQLFNVILGQMSLVGPRMITPEEAEKYGRHRLDLLTVRPGITGLWQVSGRSDLSYEDRVHLDMYYVRNYSVWLDLQILFVQTLPAIIQSRGAY